MDTQTVFDRYEVKYLLTAAQRDRLLREASSRMAPDRFGRSTVRSLYYDTDSFRLIRRSLEKPVYKEKLRVRSYAKAGSQSEVFVEIKKKYRSVVYKRRVSVTRAQAAAWLDGGVPPRDMQQIAQEIEYFRNFYAPLKATVFISCERQAFYAPDTGFRLTIDENILARTERLSLGEDPGGAALLGPGVCLLELKAAAALPLWVTSFLAREKLYPASFSKYGAAYTALLQTKKEALPYAG